MTPHLNSVASFGGDALAAGLTWHVVNFQVLPYQYNVRGVHTTVSIVTATLVLFRQSLNLYAVTKYLTYQTQRQEFIRSTLFPTCLPKIESLMHDVFFFFCLFVLYFKCCMRPFHLK